MKKVVAIIVSIVVMISMTMYQNDTIYAEEENSIDTLERSIKTIINELYGEIDYEIVEITPIYDENYNVCEYSLDIISDNANFGYLIYDTQIGDISKFKLDKNMDGFWMSNFEQQKTDSKIVKKVDLLYYELEDISDNNYYLGSKDQFHSLFYEDLLPVYCNNLLIKEKYLPKYCLFGEEYITDVCKMNYCCAAVAALNVLGQYGCFNVKNSESVKWAYGTIYSMGNVRKLNKQYVMNQEMIGGVVSTFAKWYGGMTIPYRGKENPEISFFTEAVDKRYPLILGVTTSCGDGVSGHAVSVIGYLNFKPIMYGENRCYLAVASGWGYNSDIEYILYDKINVISSYGVVFTHRYK